jgi:3-dehydroquinate synthase
MELRRTDADEFVLTYRSGACRTDATASFATTLSGCRVAIDALLAAARGRRVLVLYDRAVEHTARQVQAILDAGQVTSSIHGVAVAKKDLSVAGAIWEEMTRSRPGFVIGVGGGTICDLTGFTASTYRRGIPYALVPTTLLAMLDASIGGKTALDVAGLRNAVGTMHLPTLVVSGVEALPPDDLAGLSEAVKIAMLYSVELFDKLEDFGEGHRSAECLVEVVALAAAQKAEQCLLASAQDMGMLYGHNIAYAFERLLPIGHAESVAVGIRIEGEFAHRADLLDADALTRQHQLMSALGIDVPTPEGAGIDGLIEAMKAYKLNDDDTARMVVPRAVGARAGGEAGFLTLSWTELRNGLEGLLASGASG